MMMNTFCCWSETDVEQSETRLGLVSSFVADRLSRPYARSQGGPMGPKGKDVKVGLASKPKLAGWGPRNGEIDR